MIEIRKAKLTKELVLTKIGYIELNETGEKTEVDGVNCDWIAHNDLVQSFQRLIPHIAFMCEVPEVLNLTLDQVDHVESISVSSFTIGGEDEHEGISISGVRTLSTGKTQVLNTPFYKWEDDQPYEYMNELGEIVANIKHEVEEYLFRKKKAPKRQLEMFQDNLDEDDLHVDEEGVKLKGSKKKETIKKAS
ncbi:hypothetical protein B0I27_10784 [Arcticibacter pallidicorallinus]|uniref:Uncharacterized protein n=1 Tax=Arcticibacter pallidicorallinus TaxID=1259464 RepID=A0A2T0U0S3_9SPHI|nr:hypothetical protein [Arcticibacter pallidicorallinus]PRY51499.1 hypothetical protein B0I27_10784 [Arcticibacter pallidicorallinus]